MGRAVREEWWSSIEGYEYSLVSSESWALEAQAGTLILVPLGYMIEPAGFISIKS
jgi:hypothetical protein